MWTVVISMHSSAIRRFGCWQGSNMCIFLDERRPGPPSVVSITSVASSMTAAASVRVWAIFPHLCFCLTREFPGPPINSCKPNHVLGAISIGIAGNIQRLRQEWSDTLSDTKSHTPFPRKLCSFQKRRRPDPSMQQSPVGADVKSRSFYLCRLVPNHRSYPVEACGQKQAIYLHKL
jgi:hypothetical protein